MLNVGDIMLRARELGVGVPAFNIPYLPMMQPVTKAVKDADAFSLIEVARLEWMKFESKSLAAVAEEFARWADRAHVRLHLDHVPVIDEDHERVDYMPVFREAVSLGYESLMVDGSRLSLDENIRVTAEVANFGHAHGRPVEAELGAVLGHESGPMPPYEELFASGKGFTDVEEARRFAAESGCDWLSVAIGNIHGAIAAGARDQKKVEAQLNLEQLGALSDATGRPLVLHGGSGIRQEYVLGSFKRGITKVNVGTEIRQAYEHGLRASGDVEKAQEACYARTYELLTDWFRIGGLRDQVAG
ncbi:MAG: class II fructose-bisphosphate aldolase [Anaerolineae bacterium]|jgi:ketose-bisphosphate aldolase|nr:class II fructose-bisphosphate aldolase [Anaerolineae bacterium]